MATYKTKNGRLIGGNRYNKTSFGEKWSEVTKKETKELTKEDLMFIKGALLLTSKYQKLAKDEKTELKVTQRTFQKYPVRGLTLISPNSKTEIWIGKSTITNTLYPKKRRKVKQSTIVLKALRQIVEDDVQRERQLQRRKMYGRSDMICPISGINLLDCKTTHLDHKYPFSKLAEDFFREKGIDMERVQVRIKGTFYILSDSKLAQEWKTYHLKNAKLELVCAKANLKKSNKVY